MMSDIKTVAIVLSYNEEVHIARCIEALKPAVKSIVVVDSFSTDATVKIAESMGVKVLTHPWINHGTQFNWALEQLPENTDWVFRVDADEVVSSDLARSIKDVLPNLDHSICGIHVHRGIVFQGKKIRFGGWGGVEILRLFRYGSGQSETRWMDEHIRVKGQVIHLNGQLIDHNLKSLTWWIEKHNQYASKEAIELLKLKYKLKSQDSNPELQMLSSVGSKRWIKENIYINIPSGFRAFLYFFYRYILRLGFIDGAIGFKFHFLQGFWYRYLVDLKVVEIERLANEQGKPIPVLIKELFEVDINLA